MYFNVGPNATPEGEFTDGNPFVAAAANPSSFVGAQWLNMMQRELLAVLDAAGVTPAVDEFDQLTQAIINLAIIHGGGGGGETVDGSNVGGGVQVFKDKVAGAPSLLRFRTFGAAAGDSAITIALAGDVVTVAALGASGAARGAIRLAGQLGGTADAPDVRGIRTSDGALLSIGLIPDGTFGKRNGLVFEGATPAGSGNVAVAGGLSGLAGRLPSFSTSDGTGLQDSGIDVADVARLKRPASWLRTEVQVLVRPNTHGVYVIGAGRAPELDGAETVADDAQGPARLLTPDAVLYSEASSPPAGEGSGGVAGVRWSEWNEARGAWPGGYLFDFDTPASLTSLRLWVGLWSRDPSARTLPGAGEECSALLFDTSQGHGMSGKWRLVTSGGAGTSTVIEAASGGAADLVPAGARVRGEIFPVLVAGVVTAWEFYIGGVKLGESTTRLPQAATPLAPCLRSVNLATAAPREIKLRRIAYYRGT